MWKHLKATPADNIIHEHNGIPYLHTAETMLTAECVYAELPDGLWRVIRAYRLASGWTKPHAIAGNINTILKE